MAGVGGGSRDLFLPRPMSCFLLSSSSLLSAEVIVLRRMMSSLVLSERHAFFALSKMFPSCVLAFEMDFPIKVSGLANSLNPSKRDDRESL